MDDYQISDATRDDASTLEEFEAILTDAVRRQMVSDVRVGCQLSGGIDSSILSKIASDNFHEQFDAFSITNTAEEGYVNTVGEQCSLNVYKYSVPPSYFIDNYQRAIWHHESMLHNHSFIQYLYLIEQASQHITVMISGEGADEVAGGYANMVGGILQPFMSNLGLEGKFKSFPTYGDYVVRFSRYTDQALLLDDSRKHLERIQAKKSQRLEAFSGDNFMKHRKYLVTSKLQELFVRQDKMAMANSVETRVPLMDNKVVDFVMTLPNNQLVRFGEMCPLDLGQNPFEWMQGKYLYKELAKKYFGHEFAYRTKTRMASVANSRQWMKNPVFESYFKDSILCGMKKRGIINSNQIAQWYQNIETLSLREYELLWRATTFETWCQQFIDKLY